MSVSPTYPDVNRALSGEFGGLPYIPTLSDDSETPLPPTLAKEAAPYLRKIFAIMSDPKISGRGKCAEYGVPVHLQGFVSEYLAARGHKIKYSVGQLTKKHYVTVLTAGE